MSENHSPPKRLKKAQTTLLGYVAKNQKRVGDLKEGEIRRRACDKHTDEDSEPMASVTSCK